MIDSGSTHSFVFAKSAEELNKELEPLGYVLSVPTPSRRTMTVASIYRECVVVIEDIELLVDLMPLNMTHFDAILGMDWLVANHASMNCVYKIVTLNPHTKMRLYFRVKE